MPIEERLDLAELLPRFICARRRKSQADLIHERLLARERVGILPINFAVFLGEFRVVALLIRRRKMLRPDDV